MPTIVVGVLGGVILLCSGFLTPHRELTAVSLLLFIVGLALFFYGALHLTDAASALSLAR